MCHDVSYVMSLFFSFQKSDERVPVKYFPCINGILQIGAKVLDHSGEAATVIEKKSTYKKDKHIVFVTMVSEKCDDVTVTMPSTMVQLKERNYLLKATHENLMQELIHPIDKVCGIYSAVKHAVGMALGSKFGYSGIICIADDFAERSLGFENEKDVTFSIQISCNEVGCKESWDSVLGKSWDRRPRSYGESDKYIKSMRFYIRKIFTMSFIKCGLVTIEGMYPASSYREVIRHNLKEAQSEYLM